MKEDVLASPSMKVNCINNIFISLLGSSLFQTILGLGVKTLTNRIKERRIEMY
jgi:hypothetical protein